MLENRVTRLITSIVGAVILLFVAIGICMMLFDDLVTHAGMLVLSVCVVHILNQILYDVLNFDAINESMGGRIFKRVVFFIVLAIATMIEFVCLQEVYSLDYDSGDWFFLGFANAAAFGGTLMAGYYLIATTLHWDPEDTVFSPLYVLVVAYVLGFIVAILGSWVPFLYEHGMTIVLGLINVAMILYMIFVSLPYSEDPVDL